MGDIRLKELAGDFLGTRVEGRALRLELDRCLKTAGQVRLDFTGVSITQSCADELVGVAIAQAGQPLLDRLVFANCSLTVRAILELVISSRLLDNENLERTQRIREHVLESALPVR